MVSSDQRRRQNARKKFERQQQRREAARQKAKRRNTVVAAALTVVLAASAGAYATGMLPGGGKDDKADAAGDSTPTASRPASSPEPSMAVEAKAKYTMALKTNQGDISIAMDAAKTPRTVNSFKYLADKKFFDGTKCHRLTTEASGIFVLQCGDPEGTGYGSPGYQLPDENLDSLGKAGADGKVTFKAGTVAMANSGPNTGGSQFFLVYKDTRLSPGYTPFGTMDAAGLKVVQEIAKAGVEGGGPDGAPKKGVTMEKATVVKQ